MKSYNPALDPNALEERLVSIAKRIASVVAQKKNVDYDGSFEGASDEFGLAYGISKLYEKNKRMIALARNGKAQVKGDSFVDSLEDSVGYSLLFLDYVIRNPHLVTDGRLPESVAAPAESAAPVASTPVEQNTDPNPFNPEIPTTTAGEEKYNAR